MNHPRNVPITVFSDEEAQEKFQINERYRPLKYCQTQFKVINDSVVSDTINGLMWQRSGSMHAVTFKQAQQYIDDLNRQQFNNHNDWRLPTLDELKTLLLQKKSQQYLFINPIFSTHQRHCWSSDTRAAKTPFGAQKNAAWGVDFTFGYVFWGKFDNKFHVRALRRLCPECDVNINKKHK